MSIWKQKLLAYLHDPPHKPFRIAGHEDARASALIACGLSVEEMKGWQAQPDWAAAAADRLTFPDPERTGVRTDWRDEALAFLHPLAGTRLEPEFLPRSAAVAEDWVNRTLTGIADAGHGHQKNFLRLWRLWRDHAAEQLRQESLAHLVADTRIPDHTLWQHAAIVSALETCAVGEGDARHIEAAFLLFQIGPVQDFIAQARKTQDLWAGSYLLSFLIAQGMLAIADGGKLADGTAVEGVGPDAIVYPLLRGVPLADWHWKQKVWLADGDSLHLHNNERLTPSLSNRFLAVLPAASADQLAQLAEQTIRKTWGKIAEAVRRFLDDQIKSEFGNQFDGWDNLWPGQVAAFPQIDFVVHRWVDTEQVLAEAAKGIRTLHDGWENHPLHHAELWAKDLIPPKDRDRRCYKHRSWREGSQWRSELLNANGQALGPGERPVIDNPGFAWALHYGATDWLFAAKKNMRRFEAWHGYPRPKDALDGRSEVIGPEGNVDEFWEELRKHPLLGEKQADDDRAERHFVSQQSYGALTIIKRLWARAYLGRKPDIKEPFFDFDVCDHLRGKFKSVIEIASDKNDTWDETEEQLQLAPEESYYAVLCFDGDEMGKWVSGAKTPRLMGQLAGEETDDQTPKGYFKKHWQPELVDGLPARDVRRVLTPSYHAALSEALNNFALYCVRPILVAFKGQLIYCGGDDVLALLPAANALACAEALYWTFRGQLPDTADADEVFNSPALNALSGQEGLFNFLPKGELDGWRGGFVKLAKPRRGEPRWPFLVPGPRATASVGIAVGHVRSPMQDTIQAARDAEHCAKHHYGRDAFCLRILKRSGEALEIGGHWRDTDAKHPAVADRHKEIEAKLRVAKREHSAPTEAAELRHLEETMLRITRRHPSMALMESLLFYLTDERRGVSGRLPYRLGQLLRPLDLDAKLAELNGVVARETERVLERQAEGLHKLDDEDRAFKLFAGRVAAFHAALAAQKDARVRDYINLFLAAAWLAKHQPGLPSESESEQPMLEATHA